MSALIAVCGPDTVHVLTDAAATHTETGKLGSIHQKQVTTNRGFLVTGIGLFEVCRIFARLADERGLTFADMAEAAPALWREVRAELSEQKRAMACTLLVAGFDEKRDRLTMHVVRELDGEFVNRVDLPGYFAAPSNACAELAQSFAERFFENAHAFDPRRDGVGTMEALRRTCPNTAGWPCIGGFVTHSLVTRDSISTEAIHRWSHDRVGHVIELDVPERVVEPECQGAAHAA
jgi:hypothetical protein